MKRRMKAIGLWMAVFLTAWLLPAAARAEGPAPVSSPLSLGNLVISGIPEGCSMETAEDGTVTVTSGDAQVLTYTADGTLTVYTDVTLSSSGTHNGTVVIAGDAKVTLNGAQIQGGPAILIQSPNSVELVLAAGSENTVTGIKGQNINHVEGSYAGIEVEYEYETGEMASLTISGEGTLNATGGPNAAGIGGSNSQNGSRGRGLFGNITINSGTVNATGIVEGAGIGSADNAGDGTSGGSYKTTVGKTWGTITINGGTVNAKSTGRGAGIGGGNHTDSSKIIITGGTVTAEGNSGIGSGYGSSQTTSREVLTKGPGYYYADIEISGGTIVATAHQGVSTDNGGAGIGGGMYSDAVIKITGGDITATGGYGKGADSYHHGGSGIGGGYEGHSIVEITGGTIKATGGGAAAGIGSGPIPNQNMANTGSQGYKCRAGETTVEFTDVTIRGGDVTAIGGVSGGAGIGGGVGADRADITITGGTVRAEGGRSSEEAKRGGAGIGSGYSGVNSGESQKYFVEGTTNVTITPDTTATVTAIGGWGAAGIGSGAENTMADTITIDAYKTNLQAYADGTKFAIDTRDLHEDGSTTSHKEGRNMTGDILQGTFVHAYQNADDTTQNAEGLKSIKVINDTTDATKELTLMPEGYRSFALDVEAPGSYTVYTDEASIGQGAGRYFSECSTDVFSEENVLAVGVRYTVKTGELCDNFYLFPVKSIVVTKVVQTEDGLDASGINGTVYFALHEHKNNTAVQNDGKDWIESIEIVNGVPQNKAYFVDIEDKQYEIWEVAEDGTRMNLGTPFGTFELKKIATEHAGGSDNNALIDENQWTDNVSVINTYGQQTEEETTPEETTPEETTPEETTPEETTAAPTTAEEEIPDESVPLAPPATSAEETAPEETETPSTAPAAEEITEAAVPQAVPARTMPAPAMNQSGAVEEILDSDVPMALPVTGQQHWPILVLGLAGVAFLAAAACGKKRENRQ